MKKFCLYLLLIFTAGGIYAQSIDQRNIPAVVLNAFQVDFPKAENAKWKLDKGNFRVEFRVNGKLHKVRMDDKGEMLWFTQDLYVSELPPQVLSTIGDHVDFFDVHDADRTEIGDSISYEVSFKVDGKNHLFRIDEQGQLLKYRKELKESEVPVQILNLIRDIYGPYDLDRAKYVKEPGRSIYMLEGEIRDYKHAFIMDDQVRILKHSQDLRRDEIPPAVMESLKKSYDAYELRDADLEESDGEAVYILKIRKSRETHYVTFTPEGKVVKQK